MTIRWGVIGATGFAGKRPLPGLAKAGNCQLHAVLKHKTDAGEVAREFAAAVVYDEQEALLADPDVDAVYICTPVFLHAAQTVAAADAGKHVLVEKPMALTIDECRQMTDACKGNGVKLQIGYMRRFHPYHRKIKEMVDAGVLGRIVRARVQTHLWYPGTPDAWRLKQETGGGGAFRPRRWHRRRWRHSTWTAFLCRSGSSRVRSRWPRWTSRARSSAWRLLS